MPIQAEFLIPLHHEDLEISNKKGVYFVKHHDVVDPADEKSVERALAGVAESLGADPLQITQPDTFDPLYKMVKFFEMLKDEQKVELTDTLCAVLPGLISMTNDALAHSDASVTAEQTPGLRNGMKM